LKRWSTWSRLYSVKGLLELKKITEEKLRERLYTMPLGEKEMFRAGRNFVEIIKP
jgi:hypothetical protein